MEFILKNQIETTSSITIQSGTLSVENLLYVDPTFQYITQNFDSDLLHLRLMKQYL